ncbi:MAG: leucine-rich repeat domain-containing protein [Clostridium sp.]
MRKKSRFLTTALIMGLTFSGIYAPSGSAKAVKNIDFLVVPDAVGISTPGGEKNITISTNENWKVSGIYSYQVTNESKKEATLRRINTINDTVSIPEKIDGYTITAVGEMKENTCVVSENEVLLYANSMRYLVLPKTVTTIGNHAFAGCSSLEKIYFNHTEKLNIHQYAFADCERLQNLELNNMRIGPNAFSGVSPLSSVSIFNVDFYEITEDESTTGICPFGTRTVKKMFVNSALTAFYFPGSTSVEHLYVCGRSTSLKGNAKAYKKVKVIHTYPSAKAASFAKKKKLCYETLKVSGKMKKVTKKKTSSGLMYSWKKVTTKATKYQYSKKKWKKKTYKIPTYYEIVSSKKHWTTKYQKVLDATSSTVLSIKVWKKWNNRI